MENVFGPFQTKLKDEIKLMPLDIEVSDGEVVSNDQSIRLPCQRSVACCFRRN